MTQTRGRSREVSRVALARKASAERKAAQQLKRQQRSPSASPSPPMTPADLSDQIFVAYAHEDFHLAKKLLLRLKGIQVTGDDDPIIDSVKDEDFDYCFMPNGRVMTDAIPQVGGKSAERRREEEERMKKKERLRRCQFIWEMQEQDRENDWYRQQKARLSSKRKHQNWYHKRGRSLISFVHLSNASPEDDYSVDGDLPQVQSNEPISLSRSPPTTRVSFNDVLSSIEGPLFPYDSSEQRHYHTHTRSESRGPPHAIRKRQLIQCLLHPVDCDKDKLPIPLELKPASRLAPRSPASSSSSAISRANSWLSFRTNSASSTSTAITTPSSSPPSKPTLLSLSWVKSKSPTPISKQPRPPVATLAPVPLHATPLGTIPTPHPRAPSKGKGRDRGDGVDIGGGRTSAQRVVKHVKKLVSLATAFQAAYMSIAAYSIPCDIDRASLDGIYGGSRLGYGYHGTGAAAVRRTDSTRAEYYDYGIKRRPRLNNGCRVKRQDVLVFLSSDHISDDDGDEPPQSIQLVSASAPPPRTVLPSPLPYSVVFKAPPPLPRSPLRSRSASSSASPLAPRTGPPVWRLRPVSNPAALRLKALSNVLAAHGCAWEGRGDPTMQCGAHERMLGVAIEGGCRSVLSL